VLWRRDVKADNVAYLGNEVRVGRELERFHSVRLEPEARQIRCTVDTDRPLAFHAAGIPMSSVLGAAFQRLHDHGFDPSIVNAARRPRTRLVVQTSHALLHKTPSPRAHRFPFQA